MVCTLMAPQSVHHWNYGSHLLSQQQLQRQQQGEQNQWQLPLLPQQQRGCKEGQRQQRGLLLEATQERLTMKVRGQELCAHAACRPSCNMHGWMWPDVASTPLVACVHVCAWWHPPMALHIDQCRHPWLS